MKKIIIFVLINLLVLGTIAQVKNNELNSYLVPVPRTIKVKNKLFQNVGGRIVCEGIAKSEQLYSITRKVQKSLKNIGVDLKITATKAKNESSLVVLVIDSAKVKNAQGYTLVITKHNIILTAHDVAGLYYAATTLNQITKYAQDNGKLPCLTVSDYPDFKRRGITVDVSRCKVPTKETLFKQIDLYASWKINEIQLYTEHTFKYQNHKTAWDDASPYTADDILEIDKYCRDRFIDLVPNQNSFGHMERWLKHKEYQYLAECPEIKDPEHFTLGIRRTVCAVDPKSKEFADELYSELLPNFSSEFVNIGGDEPYELGHGRSKEACDKQGKGRVYLSYLKKINNLVQSKGKNAQFWGDIIVKHPELIPELPQNITCMIWGYRANHPFKKQCPKFKKANIPFYVCPGTSSWRSIVGRSDNAIANQLNAAQNGLDNGAIGYLNTDWGDYGHWHYSFINYYSFIYGAALSWNIKANKDIDYNSLLNRYLYKEKSNKLAQLISELGLSNLQITAENNFNMAFYQMLRYCQDPIPSKRYKGLTIEKLQNTIKHINNTLLGLFSIYPQCDDSEIIIREFKNSAQLAIFSCRLGIAKLKVKNGMLENIPLNVKNVLLKELDSIINEHRTLWMARNRVGGLAESVDNLLKIKNAIAE